MIPFQLSPVDTWKSVRKAIPKFSKVAWRLMPSQGFSSLHTVRTGITAINGGHTTCSEINSRSWGRGLQAPHNLEAQVNGLSTMPNSGLLPNNTWLLYSSAKNHYWWCNSGLLWMTFPTRHCVAFLHDQYFTARDMNKLYLTSFVALEHYQRIQWRKTEGLRMKEILETTFVLLSC